MGKPTGFLEFERKNFRVLPVKERVKNYNEFVRPLPEDELPVQGARCMDCGIPFCHSSFGCPVQNLIPEWNDLVYRGQWYQAYRRLELTNNFPEFTGRVCPAPCETACTLSINDAPVTIKQLELAIIERAFAEGWIEPQPPAKKTGKRVAIVGSGPAGLAAAQQLCRAGHQVTVFEKAPRIGGILRYGIPDFKLEKRIIDRRLRQMEAEGVRFETSAEIGTDISARYLKKSFDAVLLAVGAAQPRDLAVDGRGLRGIHLAMEYLTLSNRFIADEISADALIDARDKIVLVLGGGDTGADCVGTAIRQGAKKVYQFEILPRPREWNKPWNPEWPNWPNILRTASSHEEGCEREWSVLTTGFEGKQGQVTRANFVRVEWSDNPRKMQPLEGTEFSLKVDLVLLALGFLHVAHSPLLNQLGVEFNDRGNIRIDENYQTSVPGVFSAGDAHSGASLVVRAIFNGRQAAEAIDAYLR